MSTEHVPTTQIHTHDDNPRLDVTTDSKDLAASIKTRGILQPLTIAPHPEIEGEWLLIDGHRRLQAARDVGLDTVPVFIREDLNSRAQQITAMLTANGQRSNLTPVEQGRAYQMLLDLDMTEAAIAKQVGRTKKTVHEHVLVARLPEKARTKLHDGQLTLKDGIKLAEFADHDDLTDRVLTQLGTYNEQYSIENCRHIMTNRALAGHVITVGDVPEDRVVDDYPDGMVPAAAYTPGMDADAELSADEVVQVWAKWRDVDGAVLLCSDDVAPTVMVPVQDRGELGASADGEDLPEDASEEQRAAADERAARVARERAEAAEEDRKVREALRARAGERHAVLRDFWTGESAEATARASLMERVDIGFKNYGSPRSVRTLALILGLDPDTDLAGLRAHIAALPLAQLYLIFDGELSIWYAVSPETTLTGLDENGTKAWGIANYLDRLNRNTGYRPCALEAACIRDQMPAALRARLGLDEDTTDA